MVKAKYPDFQPAGLEDWEKEQSEENIQTADRKVHDIIVEMQKYIFSVFRTLYGATKDAYWEKGISDKSIKTKAYERSLDEEIEDRPPLETYLDVIDFKKIVENKQNWQLFRPVFNIPDPGEKGHAKNLKWMERLNELRRITAHPSEKRHYKVDDFDYIDYVHQEFFERLAEAQEHPVLDAVMQEDSDA